MPITNRFLEPENEDRRDEIRHYNIDIDQEYDLRTGKPIGRPVLNQMVISITRSSETDVPFYVQWQLDAATTKNIDICFYEADKLQRTIKIKDAYLVGYTQDSGEPGNIEETLILSPRSIELDGTEYTREAYT